MASEYLKDNSATEIQTPEMVQESVDYIKSRTTVQPVVALVCGTGMGSLSNTLDAGTTDVILYQDIPHFSKSSVIGHAGRLLLGKLHGRGVFLMQGRFHPYEGYPYWRCAYAIRVMAGLGCHTIILTNAAGSLREDFKVGDIMLVKDHFNMPGMAGQNPLRGVNNPAFGQRFVNMSDAYDRSLAKRVKELAVEIELDLKEGVYAMVGGPSFETIAECKALKILGGDVVGMSTVHECVVARQCKMRVVGFSLITNMCVLEHDNADGVEHDTVLTIAGSAAEKIGKIFTAIVSEM